MFSIMNVKASIARNIFRIKIYFPKSLITLVLKQKTIYKYLQNTSEMKGKLKHALKKVQLLFFSGSNGDIVHGTTSLLDQKPKRDRRKDASLPPLEYCTYICHISKDIYMEISQLSKFSMSMKYNPQAYKALDVCIFISSLENHTSVNSLI